MQTSAKRPVYLNLVQIRFPIGAIVSIIHRITGAVMALLVPVALWALQASLASPEQFARVKTLLGTGLGRAAVLLAIWVLVQHLYSGVRHLFIDIDVGADLPAARRSGWLTLVASIVTVVIVGALL